MQDRTISSEINIGGTNNSTILRLDFDNFVKATESDVFDTAEISTYLVKIREEKLEKGIKSEDISFADELQNFAKVRVLEPDNTISELWIQNLNTLNKAVLPPREGEVRKWKDGDYKFSGGHWSMGEEVK